MSDRMSYFNLCIFPNILYFSLTVPDDENDTEECWWFLVFETEDMVDRPEVLLPINNLSSIVGSLLANYRGIDVTKGLFNLGESYIRLCIDFGDI